MLSLKTIQTKRQYCTYYDPHNKDSSSYMNTQRSTEYGKVAFTLLRENIQRRFHTTFHPPLP